jgi:glycosyltransferase involved in cell wall biosynthesis
MQQTMGTATTTLSFIIPAYNEAASLPRTIQSIRQFVPDGYQYEILVVDNGSDDDTVRIAKELGARTFIEPNGTVAHLRNTGARHAEGAIYVFLDADTVLTEAWSRNIPRVLKRLAEQPMTATGSVVSIPLPGSWIERFWFRPLISATPRYINSAHLITTRVLFERIAGLDARLETGEDVDFSERAKAASATVINDPALRVIHEGYPKTLRAFIRREVWHGTGDFTSLQSLSKSRVALASLLFFILHGTIIIDLAMDLLLSLLLLVAVDDTVVAELARDFEVRPRTVAGGLVVVLMCVMAALRKYGAQPLHVLIVNSFLYYFYYWGRALSGLNVLSTRFLNKSRTPRSRIAGP